MESKPSVKQIVIMGFAIFAMFFGAGNLIFPPYLGVLTGKEWGIAFVGFIIGDVVLGVAAMTATLKNLRHPIGIWSRVGKTMSIILGSVFFLFNGALFAGPRTGAVAYEVGLSQIVPGFNMVVWVIIYFGLTWFFAVKPTKVVDYVGKFLTPALIILMVILEVKGAFSSIGVPRDTALVEGLFKEGLVQGYLTMDSNAGITCAYVALAAAIGYGYKKEKDIRSFIFKACVLGGVLLTLLYLGLTYLGVQASASFDETANQTDLLVYCTQAVLGNPGKYLLGVMAILACLTTAVGITSATATYFNRITNGKLSYNLIVTILCIFCAVSATIGVKGLISLCSPILNLFYPALITGIILSLFNNKIKNDNVFKACNYVAVAMGICTFCGFGFVSKMPLAWAGLEWFTPVLAAFIISMIATRNKPSKNWAPIDENAEVESYEELMASRF